MARFNRIVSTAGRFIFPSLLWNFDLKEKTLYLTFDDGPIPEVTPWVLSLLKEYNAKATFFCIGENVNKHPDVFKMVIADGHRIGNHTFNHLNGWKTSSDNYVENILHAERTIKDNLREKLIAAHPSERTTTFYPKLTTSKLQPTTTNPQQTTEIQHPTTATRKLFRPPFGRINSAQIRKLEKLNFRIVMWDVISEDYDKDKTPEYCIKHVIKYTKPGSIIVFHDSIKAFKNLEKILPQVLEYYSGKGYEFKTL